MQLDETPTALSVLCLQKPVNVVRSPSGLTYRVAKVGLMWLYCLSTSMWIPHQISGIRMGQTEDVHDMGFHG